MTLPSSKTPPLSFDDIYWEIGKRYVAAFGASGTIDFKATPKAETSKARSAPNCRPEKSHLCIGKTGRGSCVTLRKKCRVPASAQVKAVLDSILGKPGGSIDTQKPPAEPPEIKSIADLKEYTTQWQKDRGYDEETGASDLKLDTGIMIHDINHPLTYLASGRTPESIAKDYGHPDTSYKGQPTWAEESFIAVAERSFLPGVTKKLVIDDMVASFTSFGETVGKHMSPEERDFYWDKDSRRKDFERMYDELQKAKPEHKALLLQNNKRLYAVRDKKSDPWIDMWSESTVNKKYKDVYADFSAPESLGRDLSRLLATAIAVANISGNRRSYAELEAEAKESQSA
jgi:hypothetical protein